jgi:hypothetical protein
MGDLHIKIADVPGKDAWTAELRTGFPGSPGAAVVASGGAEYTRAQLERDVAPPAPGAPPVKLDLATVLKAMREDDQVNPIFALAGMRIFELLVATGVAPEWKRLRVDDTRTFLELPESLSQWPWELLMKQVSKDLQERFFENVRRPLMRLHTEAHPELNWSGSIVRILLVSGQEVLDKTNQLKASDELREIREAFHDSGLSVLIELCESPASRQDLTSVIHSFSPHIVHFIGHGEQRPGGRYRLKFQREASWEWTSQDIFSFFDGEKWKPSLVVLNACHAARFDEHAASVAEALLKAGIPAVIGAVAAFRVDYARVFAKTFYRALVQEKTIDKALTAARIVLQSVTQYEGSERRHWALPVLTVSAPPGQILRFQSADTRVKLCPAIKMIYRRPGTFADRVADRWRLLSAFEPLDGSPPVRGVILHSKVPAGKSWLVLRSIRDFVDAGYIVRFANLTGKEAGRVSIDVLNGWRGKSSPDSPVLGPLDGPHFEKFDKLYTKAKADPTMAAIQGVFKAFKQGLQKARDGRRVLLIIDEFRNDDSGKGVSPTDFREGLMNQLLLPLQKNDPPEASLDGVYALLVARRYTGREPGEAMDEDEFGLGRLNLFLKHPVRDFDGQEIDNVFDEFSDFVRNPESNALRVVFIKRAAREMPHKAMENIAHLADDLGGNP